MKLVFLGPPGAGKGTQADVLSKKFGILHISTGDILRQAVKDKTPTGLKAQEYMNKGELVPDEIVTKITTERIQKTDAKDNFILDGFPRTIAQADDLGAFLNNNRAKIDLVLYFETSDKVAIQRLTGRRVCKACGAIFHLKNMPPKKQGTCDKCGGVLYQRTDDTEETVKNRLVVYKKQTQSLIDYYKEKGILRTVSGDLDVNELFVVMVDLFKKEGLAV